MSKLIKTWDELDNLKNDKYQIVVNKEYCCGWIIPITDERVESYSDDFICNCEGDIFDTYYDNHIYLSTHTFYGSQYKYSTELLQKYGFDVEIDNWDKKEVINNA